jgi:hypothetical protein
MTHNDLELTQLMNAQLDGELTAEESERLRQILDARPDMKAEYEKLGNVLATLDQLGMEDPPASLKQNVLRAVRANPAPKTSRGWLSTLFGGGGGIRPWTTLAMGAALGVLAFAILSGNLTSRAGSDSRSMTGTMLPVGRAATYRVIKSHQFTLAQGSIVAEALSGTDGSALRLTTDAPAGTEVTVSYDPGDWEARSVKQEPAGNEVMLGTGRLSVRMLRPGHGQYLLDLVPRGSAGSPLQIAIHSPDGFVQGELEMRSIPSGR